MANTSLMEYLNGIATAIQAKTGSTKKIKLKDIASEIAKIDTFGTHEFLSPITVTANGIIDVTNYSSINVQVADVDDLAVYFAKDGDGYYSVVYKDYGTKWNGDTQQYETIGYKSSQFEAGQYQFACLQYNSSSGIHSESLYFGQLDDDEIVIQSSSLSGEDVIELEKVTLYASSGDTYLAYCNSSGYVDVYDSVVSSGDILVFNGDSFSSFDINGIVYPSADGIATDYIGSGAGLYAGAASGEIYKQELSDSNNSARVLIGASYGSDRYDAYKCLPSNVLYFTVSSSGQTYVNTLDLAKTYNSKVCNIVLPQCKENGDAYSIEYSDFTHSYSFNGLTPNQSETETSPYYASVETLNNTKIAYLDEYNSSGRLVYGDIASLYPANQSKTDALDVTTPTKTNLSAMYVAYYSPQKGLIDFGQIYGDKSSGNDVLKAYHLGTENGKYCVTSTNLSYSYSDNDNGYTNNFITVLYPHIADYSNDSTKEKASISNLTVTPNKYYILKSGNEFDSIGLENISPIKLGQTNPTYYWSAPVEGEAPSTPQVHTEVFGYIRIYQDPNGHSIDVPVTYEMITAIVNAGISINTDYVYPTE